jgi:hypothetical protein
MPRDTESTQNLEGSALFKEMYEDHMRCEFDSPHVLLTYAFAHPWTVMIVAHDAQPTLLTMPYKKLVWLMYLTYFTKCHTIHVFLDLLI